MPRTTATTTPATTPAVTRGSATLLVVLVAAVIAAALLEPVIGSLASTVVSWGCLGAAAEGGSVAVLQYRRARRN